jgi:hypothetical protein
MSHHPYRTGAVIAFMLGCIASPARAAAPAETDFFGAALCQPPYSITTATAIYEAAEKLAKPDTSSLGAAIYHLPAPVSRDGFVAQDVVFTGSSVGILVDGYVAAELAKRYDLEPEKSHLFGTSSLGFSRLLPDAEQGMKGLGLISIVARQGPAMQNKTLLMCEFVSDEDRASMEELEKQRP